MSRDYHTRLPPDHAEGVDQYAEDHDINKSEVLRRAVSDFLANEGYPREDGEKQVATDGGFGIASMFASFLTGFSLVVTATVLGFAITTMLGLTDIPRGVLEGLTYVGIFWSVLPWLGFHVGVPQRIDQWLAERASDKRAVPTY